MSDLLEAVMAGVPVDLIRLEGEGNSVILRILGSTGQAHPARACVLAAEFLVYTPFVRGTLKTWIYPEDLREWQQALDSLDAGRNTAWRDGASAPWLLIDLDEHNDRCHVTIKDQSMSLTTVTVTVPLVDAWFDDAYRRLDLVWETWPQSDNQVSD